MYHVVYSKNYETSLLKSRYGRNAVEDKVADFLICKQTGRDPVTVFSDDKPSYDPGNGYTYKSYQDIRHCHLDIDRADPLLAYRIFEAEKKIVLIAITDHREMFQQKKKFVSGHPDVFKKK